MDAARHTTRFRIGGVAHERTVVASPADQVVAVHLKAGKRGAVSLDLKMTSPQRAWSVQALPGDELLLSGTNNEGFGIAGALKFQSRVKVIASGGKVSAGADVLSVRGADEVTILIAMATSYRAYADVSTGGASSSTRRSRGAIGVSTGSGRALTLRPRKSRRPRRSASTACTFTATSASARCSTGRTRWACCA
ncbi:glycoside hydrolase N-terminal domain-containing protein [Novosphingobium resinovorum]